MSRNFSSCEAITSFDPVSATLAIITPVRDGFLLTFETSVANWPFPVTDWLCITETAALNKMDTVFETLAELKQNAA